MKEMWQEASSYFHSQNNATKRWSEDTGLWRRGEMDLPSLQRGRVRGLKGNLIAICKIPNAMMQITQTTLFFAVHSDLTTGNKNKTWKTKNSNQISGNNLPNPFVKKKQTVDALTLERVHRYFNMIFSLNVEMSYLSLKKQQNIKI